MVPDPEVVAARRVLLDALEALGPHRKAAALIGAQATYLQVGHGDLAGVPFKTDGDLALDPSIDCGSKFAIEGIFEALGTEVAAFGIHVTAVALGQFRTDCAGRSMRRTQRSITDYDTVINPVHAARQVKTGQQPQDPNKVAQALLAVAEDPGPPIRLFSRQMLFDLWLKS